ncbi:DUF6519 domain-containing protein [Variovorax sp. YR216]|uniref:DUF6519 domain-containing protein n=1 Tax=Variovorax sp. YR216 TaxID=1882828 RepID=UPI00089B8D70|nr:DUF6519 domain-containing protein [Variovorax sp. YR216]SEB20193.1 hypothetical protein SAMN05444680_11379 [Variovorax sp. YR216]
MKADFSRNTFDPRKHYSAVLQQQGRVQVDADWNEQQLIHAHRSERVGIDVVGPSGAPQANPGFGLGFTADGSDLTITSGRYYVDGIPCEIEPGESLVFSSTGDSKAQVALPRSDLADFRVGQWVLLNVTSDASQILRITAVAVSDGALTLTLGAAITRPPTPATGAFNGVLRRITTYLTQADFPGPDFATVAAGANPAVLALPKGLYVAYLDVWHRLVSALDDPAVRESALGGPDTAVRAKTICQLKLLAVTPPQADAPACGTAFPEWDALTGGSSGALSARAAPSLGQTGPCLIPPGGGYRGLDNQLYRVEIHGAGTDGNATFKWSRDNGSVVTHIRSFNGSTLTVDSTGPDDALGLANGQWVEIIGDADELHGRPGQLIQIATVQPATSTLTFAASPTPIDPSLNPKMRRWDGGATVVPAGGGGWLELEQGVQVQFTAGQYATGDYWLIPARSGATASVEWNHAAPQPPGGVVHHFARIGLLRWSGAVAGSLITDCRRNFAPLTHVPPALHVTGISWQNDDVLSLSQFVAGLSISMDGAPIGQYSVNLDPGTGTPVPTSVALMTASDNSMVVTVEIPTPVPNQPANAQPPLTMPVPVVLSGNPISWQPKTNTLVWVPSPAAQSVVNALSGGQARVRVRMKGNFIWGDLGQERLYLDGEVRGQPGLSASRTNSLRTDLSFPSGCGRRYSDFESWFTLQLAATPVSLRSFGLNATVLLGDGAVTGQVVLASVAQSPVTVTLAASSAPSIPVVLNGGNPLTIPAGQTSASFTITVSAPTLSSVVNVAASVPAIPNSQLTTSLTTNFTVVVLAVAVSPPTALLLAGTSQQFTASVSSSGVAIPGGVDTGVTWSCNGGSISASGNYVAPGAAGVFNVVATSIADPRRTAQAAVTVRVKGKDKDKDKEASADKAVRIDKVALAEKVRDVVLSPAVAGPVIAGPAVISSPVILQRSFIAPAQRPDVGPTAAPAAPTDPGKSNGG